MKTVLLLLLRAYQLAISPLLGDRCRFYPSCSNYALEAIARHGVARGGMLTAKRLCKCHPWHPGGVDPVPEAFPAAHGPAECAGAYRARTTVVPPFLCRHLGAQSRAALSRRSHS